MVPKPRWRSTVERTWVRTCGSQRCRMLPAECNFKRSWEKRREVTRKLSRDASSEILSTRHRPIISVDRTGWHRSTVFLPNPRGRISTDPGQTRPEIAHRGVGQALKGHVPHSKRKQHAEGLQDEMRCSSAQTSAVPSSPSRQISHGTSAWGSGGGISWMVCPGLDKVSDRPGASRCQPEMTIPPEVHRVQPVNGTGVAGNDTHPPKTKDSSKRQRRWTSKM